MFAYLFATVSAYGQIDLCPDSGVAGGVCGKTENAQTGFSNVMGAVINGAFVLAIVAALGYLIYGGVRWILSQGDKTKVEAARNHIVSAIIGLVIVFMSYFVINVVARIFGVDLGNLELPTL